MHTTLDLPARTLSARPRSCRRIRPKRHQITAHDNVVSQKVFVSWTCVGVGESVACVRQIVTNVWEFSLCAFLILFLTQFCFTMRQRWRFINDDDSNRRDREENDNQDLLNGEESVNSGSSRHHRDHSEQATSDRSRRDHALFLTFKWVFVGVSVRWKF